MDKIPNGYALVKMSLLEELDEYHDLGPISRLRELAEADKDGRCVVLPYVRTEADEGGPK